MIMCMLMKKINVFVCVLISLFVTTAVAGDFQSHASIFEVAQQFMLRRVAAEYEQSPEIKQGRLDSRLQLNKCSVPLVAYLPKGSRDLGRVTVGVKCLGTRPWSLHVPVIISIYKNIVVAAHPVLRGKLLVQDDLKLARRDLASLPQGYIEDLTYGTGMKLKRSLKTGMPLTPFMIKKPRIVTRGQKVSIVARSGSLEVRVAGKALGHGAVGERIGVINLISRRKLEGIVTAKGEVNVDI